jgi:circadian clock protein KaiB
MNRRSTFKFQLYVAGDAPNSAQALANLTTLCDAHLEGRYEIEIVDVFKEPKRALAGNILMTPTLVKVTPSPVRRIIGTLTQPLTVLHALGLPALDETNKFSAS